MHSDVSLVNADLPPLLLRTLYQNSLALNCYGGYRENASSSLDPIVGDNTVNIVLGRLSPYDEKTQRRTE